MMHIAFKVFIFSLFLLLSNYTKAQQHPTDINFPLLTSNALQISSSEIEKIINIYITKDHTVYVENTRIIYWDEIISEILKVQRALDSQQMFIKMLFNCDRNTEYAFLDRIKQEAARSGALFKVFYYRVGEENSNYWHPDSVHGTIKEKIIDEPVGTRGNRIISIKTRLRSSLLNTKVMPKDEESRNTFRNYLYEGNIGKIKELLSKYQYRTIQLLPEKNIS